MQNYNHIINLISKTNTEDIITVSSEHLKEISNTIQDILKLKQQFNQTELEILKKLLIIIKNRLKCENPLDDVNKILHDQINKIIDLFKN